MSEAFWCKPSGESGSALTVEMLDKVYKQAMASGPEPAHIVVHPSRWHELERLKRTWDWFIHFLPRQYWMKERHWSELSKRKQQKRYVQWAWNEAMYASHLGVTAPNG